MDIHLPALAPVMASGALIVFILYRRIRRSIGRQKLAPRRISHLLLRGRFEERGKPFGAVLSGWEHGVAMIELRPGPRSSAG